MSMKSDLKTAKLNLKFMRKIINKKGGFKVKKIFGLALGIMLLAGCSWITPEQQSQVKEQIKTQVNNPDNVAKVQNEINKVLK